MALNEKKAMNVLFGEETPNEPKAAVSGTTIDKITPVENPGSGVAITPGQTKVGAVARLIVLLVAIVNQICTILGLYTFPTMDENASQLISVVLVVASALYGYWMNNSWTTNAKFSDQIMDALQKGDISLADIFTVLAKISSKADDTNKDNK